MRGAANPSTVDKWLTSCFAAAMPCGYIQLQTDDAMRQWECASGGLFTLDGSHPREDAYANEACESRTIGSRRDGNGGSWRGVAGCQLPCRLRTAQRPGNVLMSTVGRAGITLRREDSQRPPTPDARVNDDRKNENESESASFHGDILRRKGRSPTSDRAKNPLHRVIRPVTGRKSMEEA